MRIGIDASGTFGWRGPSRNIKNLIRHLIEFDGRNVYYLFVPQQPTYELQARPNFRWVTVNKKRYIPWLNISLPISAVLNKIDMMIFPNNSFWLVKPVNTIIFTRTNEILRFSDTFAERLGVFFRKLLFKCVADKVIANSRFNASVIHITCGIPEYKISIIHNAVDPIFLSSLSEYRPDYGNYILYVGGSTRQKNLVRLIRAHEKLVTKGHDINLVIVGGVYTSYYDVPLDELIPRDIKSIERIILHGIEHDSSKLANIYRNAKLVVFPSLTESFGMISVEAMACGCPLVASCAPAIPEIAGDAAEYFNPYDIDDMVSKIERVLANENLREALISKGRERVARYNWQSSISQLLQIVEEVKNQQ